MSKKTARLEASTRRHALIRVCVLVEDVVTQTITSSTASMRWIGERIDSVENSLPAGWSHE